MVRSHVSKLSKTILNIQPLSPLTWLFFSFYSTVIASNILLVDEIMRAGMSSLKG